MRIDQVGPGSYWQERMLNNRPWRAYHIWREGKAWVPAQGNGEACWLRADFCLHTRGEIKELQSFRVQGWAILEAWGDLNQQDPGLHRTSVQLWYYVRSLHANWQSSLHLKLRSKTILVWITPEVLKQFGAGGVFKKEETIFTCKHSASLCGYRIKWDKIHNDKQEDSRKLLTSS